MLLTSLGFFLIFALSRSELVPKKFHSIPLGNITATGWLYDQLIVQTNGVAGHMHKFYDLVSKTDWVGGPAYYSYLEEAGSYWFNAMVPNAVLVNHPELKQKTREFFDYVLDHQDETGWLGPEVGTSKPRYLWGRYPYFLGAIQMVEYDPSLTDRLVSAMHKFVKLANVMLRNGEGVDDWAATRWEDFVVALQWLYDNYPEGQEEFLVDTMVRLKWSGTPWQTVFSEEMFPKGPVEDYKNPYGNDLWWHGVNMAEGMKSFGATYRFTHNESDLEAGRAAWDIVYRYHGRPSGAFGADELLSGLEAARGTELCLVVEEMFSGSFMYQVSGDPDYADLVERMTYNALPATLTADMWGRQYLQQQNQVAAKNMTPNPFPEDGPDSNIFGLEPNYPCCTVNFPQGWPKFITNAFVLTADRMSLVHLYLGPFNTSVVLADGNIVTSSVATLYPFGDLLTTTITATKDFTYYVRVPKWVSVGSLRIGEQKSQELSPVNGLQPIPLKAGTTTFVLDFPSEIMIENRLHGSVAVHRGPINYAFDIPRSQQIIKSDPREPRAVDLQLDATDAWEYAIDPTSLQYFHRSPKSGILPSPIFDSHLPPVFITARACLIDWTIAGDTFAAPPPENPDCVGPETTIRLTPFGSTKLRISEFPVFQTFQSAHVAGGQYPIML